MQASGGDEGKTADAIFQRVLDRSITSEEQSILLADQQEYLKYYQSNPDDAGALINVGDSTPDAQLDASTLAAWTMVCNQVLNLDETLNK